MAQFASRQARLTFLNCGRSIPIKCEKFLGDGAYARPLRINEKEKWRFTGRTAVTLTLLRTAKAECDPARLVLKIHESRDPRAWCALRSHEPERICR